MIKAYKVIEDTEQHITYEYNSLLSWSLFASLGVGMLSFATNNILPMILCGITMVYYLYVGIRQITPVNRILRQGLKEGKLKMEGSKYSFKNPLRLTLSKEIPSEEPKN